MGYIEPICLTPEETERADELMRFDVPRRDQELACMSLARAVARLETKQAVMEAHLERTVDLLDRTTNVLMDAQERVKELEDWKLWKTT